MMSESIALLRAFALRGLVAALIVLGGVESAAAAGLTLAWDRSAPGTVSGYMLVFGQSAGSRSQSIRVNPTVSRFRVENLNPGTRYYFVVQAIGTGGQISAPSAVYFATKILEGEPALLVRLVTAVPGSKSTVPLKVPAT